MHPELTLMLAQSRHREAIAQSQRRRPWLRRDLRSAPAPRWEALTVRLATSADKPALERLAELEETTTPAEPVLLDVVMQRPVAALSLANGKVVADPFTHTRELLELMKVRARQLRRAA
jgi:hypothetical protein